MNILNHEKPCSWNTINWKSIRSRVFKWQRKIYIASKENNIVRVRTLQNRILESRDAKLLALQNLRQDKAGRKKGEVEGIKSLNLKERLELVSLLKFPTKSKPLRRKVTIKDRCLQALFKLALEPEWEAKFALNSCGFRLNKNAHNAIVAIQSCIQKRSKFVLDADISKCFDKINHRALLNIIGFKGKYRKQVQYWLETGVLDSRSFQSINEIGLSATLVKIAFSGLENHLKKSIKEIPLYDSSGRKAHSVKADETLDVIRYANNFVILHNDLNVIIHCKNEARNFLSKRGLELSEKKIRITHTLEINDIESKLIEFDGKIGFNFLGFTIKQYKTKDKSPYNKKNKLYYKSLIYPSPDSTNNHQKKLHNIILKEGKGLNEEKLIDVINPIIRGWAIYFGISNDLKTQDYLLYLKLRKWSSRIKAATGVSKWTFVQMNAKLLKHIDY